MLVLALEMVFLIIKKWLFNNQNLGLGINTQLVARWGISLVATYRFRATWAELPRICGVFEVELDISFASNDFVHWSG